LNAGEIKVDKTKPITQLQIRLHNGTVKKIQINTTAKVITIFDYVMAIAPIDGTFQLVAGFPPKPIENVNKTIEEADLLDSAITQKIV